MERRRLKVLLVDDEVELVTTLAERLALREIDALCAFNGAEAVERVEKNDFDVAVLDVKMPGMGGLEVLKRIKAIRPTIQVILLTGRASEKESRIGLGEGAFDYLVKPIDIQDLIEKMKEAAAS